MRTILHAHPCAVRDAHQNLRFETESQFEQLPMPHLYVLKGALVYRCLPHTRIAVEALLDTGCDITIVKPEKIKELENRLDYMISPERTVFYRGFPVPAYDLAFVLPTGHPLSSHYRVIAPPREEFDVADMWLGQDIFNQLVITFDGINGTVTIARPGKDD